MAHTQSDPSASDDAGLCRYGDDSDWFASHAVHRARAIAVCNNCPIQRECALDAQRLAANGVDHGHPRRSLSCSGRGPRRYRPHSQSHLGGLHQRRAGVGPARPCHERQWQLLHRPPGSQRGSRLRTHAALCRDQTDLLPTWPSPNVRETRTLAQTHQDLAAPAATRAITRRTARPTRPLARAL